MKVKIGNTIYSPEDQPILIILEPIDKLNILAMRPGANIFASYPKNIDKAELEKFMDLGKKQEPKGDVPPADPIKKPEIVKP